MRTRLMRLSLTLLAVAFASCGLPPPPRMTFYDITETTQAAIAAQLWLENLERCPEPSNGKVMRVGSLRPGELDLVEGTLHSECAEHRFERCCGQYEARALVLRSGSDEIEIRGSVLPEPLTRRGGLTQCEWDAWFDRNRRPDVAVVGSIKDGYLEAELFCVPPRRIPTAETTTGDAPRDESSGGEDERFDQEAGGEVGDVADGSAP